ncbi:hypothetical protein PMIN06_002277 [Paraphaeosphaeria minitans]|uniref:MARVEL domain-containing protein n=1 Tax=Paraphaeosphaeria minitans TaxID=565426 RepID=A0A9P6KUU2_9PLEO|nr:hypothetical protein PMIN01_01798 [Paraphaeosphaeria minitans]
MSSQEATDDSRPAVPPRSSRRDSTSNSTSHRDSLYRASPQTSPVQPAHPVVAESSSEPPVAPAVPEKSVQQQQQQPAPTGQPTQAQQVHNLFPATAAPETIKTKHQELQEGDAHWKWKVGFRAISIIVGLIGIGCAAWITARYINSNNGYSSSSSSYYYYYFDDFLIPYTLVTFVLSVLWSAACVIAFFASRPNGPIHPGAQVGCDLLLWLGFAVTGAFAVVGTLSVYYSGSDDYSSSSGEYTQASNGTWVWTSSSYSSSYSSSSRSCESYSSSSPSSCAAQDAYFNAFMHSRDQRYNLDLTVTVCQFIALLMHFMLFVWACVDTARRNSRGVSKDAEKLAADIVMNMVKNGAIIPAPGQAYFGPMAQQGHPMGAVPMMYPPQQYYTQQQFQGQHPGQYNAPTLTGKAPMPQPAMALSSNEKSVGARYA